MIMGIKMIGSLQKYDWDILKSMERLIFHIDVNSAFLSWESARRVSQGLPDLREIPSCVGGDPKKRTEYTRCSRTKYRRKCGHFLSVTCYFWEKPPSRSFWIRESVLLVIWQGNGKQMYSSGLEKNQSTDEKWRQTGRIKAQRWYFFSALL